jgi:hypothetical protein
MRELRQNWLDIFASFRVALDPKKMLLGFVGALLSVVIVLAVLFAFQSRKGFPEGFASTAELIVDPCQHYKTYSHVVLSHLNPHNFGFREMGFLALTGILLLLVWSYFGGAILRSAAVEFCKDDRVDLKDATTFARKKFSSFFWAPIVPLIGIAFFMFWIWLGGIAGRIPFAGPIVVGLFFCLALLAGFLILLIAIGSAFGSALMGPTIATEGTDAFDAISRAFSYVYGRPWRFVWYLLVGSAYSIVCIAFVAAFSYAMIKVALLVGAYGMGEGFRNIQTFLDTNTQARDVTTAQRICAILMKAAIIFVWGMVGGFAVSMKCSIITAIYCLLRKDVDGTDMTEVYVEEEEEASLETPPAELKPEAPQGEAVKTDAATPEGSTPAAPTGEGEAKT